MTPPRLIELSTRHQVHLERLKAGYTRDFITSLSGVDTAVTQTLAALQAVSLSEVSRAKLEASLAQLEATQASIFDAALEKFLPRIRTLSTYEASFEVTSLKDVMQAAAHPQVKSVQAEKLFQQVLAKPIQATGEKLEPFIKDWSKKTIKRVNNEISIGHAQGKTVEQVARRIRGTKAAGYKDGIAAVTQREATAVVHTAVQHTASVVRFETWDANKDIVEGYEFVATLDGSTTAQCRSLDGKKFKLGKGPVPPLHIRCRSTTAATLNDSFDFLNEGATRSSMGGYVNADLTYYDWLKSQPQGFQDSVLGKTRGTLFREGGLTAKRFADLQLDRNFDPLTLDQMRALEPQAFLRAGLN